MHRLKYNVINGGIFMSKNKSELCTCDHEINFKENERMLLLSKLSEAVDFLFKKCLKGNIRDENKEMIGS